jgi:IclR family mhp operon transcriptional activator
LSSVRNEDDDAPNGALARGLRVLAALNDLETATISGLVNETALPKATVIRLLQTLQAEGYAAQDRDTLTYRATPKVASLSRSLIGKNQTESMVQVALDMLADLIKWPAEYLVIDGLSMLIQSNNRERAPIKLKLFERRRFPILESAAGIAALSSLEENERSEWLRRLVKTAAQIKAARQMIKAAAAAGYATRALKELGPNMRVAAVPVAGGGGAISVVYFDDVVSQLHLESTLLPKIKKAAMDIAGALKGNYPR